MANPEHVAVVRRGATAIEEWRRKHPGKVFELSEANLRQTDLNGANLSEANLYKADLAFASLCDANLSGAKLNKADLSAAFLIGADICHANLSEVILTQAHLSRVDLSDTDISVAEISMVNLQEANLSRANLSKSRLALSVMSWANLSDAYLVEADLSACNLTQTNLSNANLSKATLFEANLSGANLSKADFSGADLSYITLKFAELSETNLSNTNLRGAKLYFDASKANLTGATMSFTTLGNCNMANGMGLQTVKHEGPSFVDYFTLANSFIKAGNRFTPDLELFFLNTGVPKHLLDLLPKILASVQYYSCFVCYGQPDHVFAEKLVQDLRKIGVSCWLYSMDATPGERTWEEISRRRREAEKMIILCSAKALVRDAVLKEIEEQIDEDPDKIVPISLDELWKQNGFVVRRGQRDLKPFLLERNYADFCDELSYHDSISRLLKGIKRKELK